MWGEVSLGVNVLSPLTGTAMFAKFDVTFGDDVERIGDEVGMRVTG
jgi:hypothetical protein